MTLYKHIISLVCKDVKKLHYDNDLASLTTVKAEEH